MTSKDVFGRPLFKFLLYIPFSFDFYWGFTGNLERNKHCKYVILQKHLKE